MKEKSSFFLGVITGITALLSAIAGSFAISSIDVFTLVLFCIKSFLLGACVGVMTKIGRRKIVDYEIVEKSWNKTVRKPIYEYYPDPNTLWFVAGFGIVVISAAAFLITSFLALTTIFVFSFGFMLVFSGAIGEILDPRNFILYLCVAIIATVVIIVIILVLGPLISS